jgi:sec-independent protein translocase protein TatA
MSDGIFPPLHPIVILVIALFVFGPVTLPELGKSLGEGIKGSKNAMNEKNLEGPLNPKTRPASRINRQSYSDPILFWNWRSCEDSFGGY